MDPEKFVKNAYGSNLKRKTLLENSNEVALHSIKKLSSGFHTV
jgi:hypothetical protein